MIFSEALDQIDVDIATVLDHVKKYPPTMLMGLLTELVEVKHTDSNDLADDAMRRILGGSEGRLSLLWALLYSSTYQTLRDHVLEGAVVAKIITCPDNGKVLWWDADPHNLEGLDD